ncbi:GNAT family N-acetyltransferase [Deltaproteobacteria bacterium TL4]
MKVVILHEYVPENARKDEVDVLIQAEAVSQALLQLGHCPETLSFSLDLPSVLRELERIKPDLVFNLVETVEGQGNLIYFAPALLDYLGIPYTGATTEAMFLTSNKILTKQKLHSVDIPTAPWCSPGHSPAISLSFPDRYILKLVWEEGSVGLDEDSVISANSLSQLQEALNQKRKQYQREAFAEKYIEGREFNLSLLADDHEIKVLSPAEVCFDDYTPEKICVVGYRAKWESSSFEYTHTRRSFDFSREEAPLLNRMTQIAQACWGLFDLRGYARVDFRVDARGTPWVLEINANPCISPDAGFVGAACQDGLEFPEVIARIIRDSLRAPTERIRTIVQKYSDQPYPSAEGTPVRISTKVKQSPALKKVEGLTYREKAQPSDCAAIQKIVASSGFFCEDEVKIAVELVEERLAKGERSGYFFIFAEHYGEVIGYTCFGPIDGTLFSFDFYWLAVLEEWRGRGIGMELIQRTEQSIARSGGTRIYIETSSRDQYTPTRKLYLKTGYIEEAVIQDFYAPGDGKVIYTKVMDSVRVQNPSLETVSHSDIEGKTS